MEEAQTLVIRGSGHATEDEAAAAGRAWRGVLERAFGATGVGAGFGDRSLRSMRFAQSIHDRIERDTGRPVVADTDRMITFPTECPPVLVSSHARGVVRPPRETLVRALGAAEARAPVTERERVAYSFFAASFFVDESPEARFALLMMAVETLIEQQRRDPSVVQHVDDLMGRTRDSGLTAEVIDSLMGPLGRLKRESITQGGRRLASTLDWGTYDGLAPAESLHAATTCAVGSSMRKLLAHRDPRWPTWLHTWSSSSGT